MKNGKGKISSKTYRQMAEFTRIGNRAVSQAQEENHRLGLPNIYSRNGKIVYEMPNGEIIAESRLEKFIDLIKENSQDNKDQES